MGEHLLEGGINRFNLKGGINSDRIKIMLNLVP